MHWDLAKELNTKFVGINKGHLWEQFDLPLYLTLNKKPLLVNFVNTAPLFYKNKIVTVMDTSWKEFPNAVSWKFLRYYSFIIPKILKSSQRVVTISNFSKNEIIKNFGVPKKKLSIIYSAVSRCFKALNCSKDNFILSVSSIQKYKNFNGLLKAYKLLKKKGLKNKLVIVGERENRVFSDAGINVDIEGVEFTGYISDKKLIELYNKARLFVFPSFFEGFGIPPLEAMACGCPCVVSNAASLPEVCGNAAYYVDPYDIDDIAKGIEKVLTDENLRQDLIKNGFENVKRFSWEKSAQKMIEIIDNL